MKMKNKKLDQIENKIKHREQLRINRSKETNVERHNPSLREKPTILIVCEGENTEPSYFRQFKLLSADIVVVGTGCNTLSLVNEAKEKAKEKKYNQVWCVFDKDDFSDFDKAIKIAEKNKFKVAYSNQAFEYWIILHFEDHQGVAMDRKDYNNKINKHLESFCVQYDGKKSKCITEKIFSLLNDIDDVNNKRRVVLAIERAKRNFNRLKHINPAQAESSTTVFKLVEEILKYTDNLF